ncbi:MAG: CDP-alcohol phosphatidyltransferase family protein [Balneola sp.]|nr:MAG: CDP-alcohol phosphatidyltransferase family protein [Balneola sp.]
MISIYELKPRFQKLLNPVLKAFNRVGITANQITLSSILLSAIIGILFSYSPKYNWLMLAVPVGLFLRMALNALDGMMARTYDQQSKIGEALNEIGDVLSDLFIYFPLLLFFDEAQLLIVVFLCLSILNEFSGILSKTISGERRYDGPMGKSDRAFIISCIALLIFFEINLLPFQMWIFSIINLLILVSTFKRLKAGIS